MKANLGKCHLLINERCKKEMKIADSISRTVNRSKLLEIKKNIKF